MTSFDFSPLFRSTVGFDRLARLMDAAQQAQAGGSTYPPYNIERTDDNEYRITMAVAGFTESELSVVIKEQTLTVTGKHGQEAADRKFLHRGIASRDFVQKFQVADHVRVTGADLGDGLLTIDLIRELPEAMKPRTIKIGTGAIEGLVKKAKTLIEGESEKAA